MWSNKILSIHKHTSGMNLCIEYTHSSAGGLAIDIPCPPISSNRCMGLQSTDIYGPYKC